MATAKKRRRAPAGSRMWGTRWSESRRRAALLAILALGAVLMLARLDPELSAIGDNAEYVTISQSLLAGHGLTHENDPALKPETKYPPVYPMLLAPFVALFPGRVVPLKLVSTAAGLVSIWLAFLLIELRAGTGMGALVALLMAANSNFLNFSQEVLAEISYLAMSLAVFWYLEKERLAERAAGDRAAAALPGRAIFPRLSRASLLALLFAALASNTRSVGLGLGIAAALYYFFARRRRESAAWFGLFVLVNVPWFLRNRLLGTAGAYAEQIMMKNPYRAWLGRIGPADLVDRVRENIGIYTQQAVPELLAAPLRALPPTAGGFVLLVGVLLVTLTLFGLAVRYRRDRSALELYFLFFLATCLVWPQVWSSVRFLVPVLPLFLFYFIEAFRAMGGWASRRWGPGFSSPALAWGGILLVLVFQAADTAAALKEPRGLPPEWAGYYEAADWVARETPASSIVVCRSSYLFYLRAHRKTVGYVFSEKPEEVLDGIREVGASYVVVDQFRWTNTTARYLIPALKSRMSAFKPVHQSPEPATWVLAVQDSVLGGGH